LNYRSNNGWDSVRAIAAALEEMSDTLKREEK